MADVKKYGWKPDVPDFRDLKFRAPELAVIPPSTDLRSAMPPVYDQGNLGSCTGNAIAGAVQFERAKQAKPDFVPSRLFIYYNERVLEGTVKSDSGAYIRDGFRAINSKGVCPESGKSSWPYDIAKFTRKPPASCYTFGLKNQAVQYQRMVPSLDTLRSCLADGYPFVFGFAVYTSFETHEVAATGDVPMPQSNERLLGGHAVLAVGYDDASGRFLVRNSWGPGWGKAGYFTMPYDYLINTNLADDFWTLRLVE